MRRSRGCTRFAIAGLALACNVEEPTGPTGSGQPELNPQPAGPAAVVVTTTIDVDQTGDVGRYTSLAIGSDRRQHVAYWDATKNDLKYATCASGCGAASNWTKGAIDETAVNPEWVVGPQTSLRVADGGRRHVAYQGNGGVWYATCAPSAACTGAADWTKARLETDAYGVSLALTKDGAKEVAYIMPSSNIGPPHRDLKVAVCLSACGQTANWTRVVVDQMPNGTSYGGEVTSLTSGPDGRRHISYFYPGTNVLKYATCLSGCTNASSWQKLTIDNTGGIAGLYSSLGVGQDGVLHVSYYDYSNGNLKYARCAFDCTTAASWKKVSVLTAYDVGLHTSLAIETNGRVHVSSYQYTGSALFYATCNADCTVSWNWTKAVLDGVNSSVGQYSSLAARDDLLYITYYDRGNGNLKYLRRVPLNPF